MFSCRNGILVITAVFFLYRTGEDMSDTTVRPYLTRAVCHEVIKTIERGNETSCSSLEKNPELEDEVQTQSGFYLIYYRLLLNIPVIVLSMFCGSYSDKHGRKLPILLPCFGSMIAATMYLTSNMLSDYKVQMILGGSALQRISGKSSLITMAANSIVFDLSSAQTRTRNFGNLLAMNYFGGTLGALMSGVFQDLLDINAVFVAIIILNIIAISFIFIFVSEDEKKKHTTESNTSNFCQVFQVGHIKETIAVTIKYRTEYKRFILISLIIGLLTIHFCNGGETDVKFMFLTRSPLSWSKSWFGYFVSMEFTIMVLCLLLLVPLFSRKLNLSDVTIVTIGLFSLLAKVIFWGFSTTSWMIYVSLGLGVFIGMVPSTLRSLISKTLNEDEAGKVFSILSCGETVSKFLGSLVFVNLYTATAHIFSGIAFITEAFIVLTVLVVLLVMYRRLQYLQSSLDHVIAVVTGSDDEKTVDQKQTQTSVDPTLT